MTDTVGIVIVSHSKDIAKGTADMVRQMVGRPWHRCTFDPRGDRQSLVAQRGCGACRPRRCRDEQRDGG